MIQDSFDMEPRIVHINRDQCQNVTKDTYEPHSVVGGIEIPRIGLASFLSYQNTTTPTKIQGRVIHETSK